jgi:hypothetical protein
MASRREQVVAWMGAVLVAAYFGWIGVALWRGAKGIAGLLISLGAAVPAPTQFVTEHRMWLLVVYVIGALIIIAKEGLIRDKRFSMMVTALSFIILRGIADAVTYSYYLPLLDLIKKMQ